MDQVKIGSFLRNLRKEKNLTQDQLADQLNVSNRTISRWETGTNMPDIAMLVDLADIYDVTIPEIIHGERKSETMDQDIKETAVAMAKYSQNELENGKQKVIGIMLIIFGLFVIISALMIFPNESSWGSIYSILGSIALLAGVYLMIRQWLAKASSRILTMLGCAVILFSLFTLSDYLAVEYFHQVPRFRYETSWHSEKPNQFEYKTLFFNVIQKNPGTDQEEVYIVK